MTNLDESNISVIVLGDVGRSPRMQYHTVSISKLPNIQVNLIGYKGESCIDPIENSPNIKKYLFDPFPPKSKTGAFSFYAIRKIWYLFWMLFYLMWNEVPIPKIILVQNPPSIPTLIVVSIFRWIYKVQVIVDWHNFSYSILELEGKSRIYVRVMYYLERLFGSSMDIHFCVTKGMKKWLTSEWGISPIVLYDKPPASFHKCSIEEKHNLFSRLPEFHVESSSSSSSSSDSRRRSLRRSGSSDEEKTLFTSCDFNKSERTVVSYLKDRPALIVSSTSWTIDEDFSILLNALIILDKKISDQSQFPYLVFVITGKGPMQSHYKKLIHESSFKKIVIHTMWLQIEDYPLLLGSADLGISLHTSSSGLDLPMKVVDMFGAGLPVCAVGFKCLDELVKHRVNGLIFHSEVELSNQLYELFQGFHSKDHLSDSSSSSTTSSRSLLQRLSKGVQSFRDEASWESNWKQYAEEHFNYK